MPIRRAFNSNFQLQRAERRSEVQTWPDETRQRPDQAETFRTARPPSSRESLSFFGESEHSLDRQDSHLSKRLEARGIPAFCFALLCLCLISRDVFKFALKRDTSSTAQKQLIAGHVKLATDHSASVIENMTCMRAVLALLASDTRLPLQRVYPKVVPLSFFEPSESISLLLNV